MKAKLFKVGPFSGFSRRTSIRVWGAVAKSDIDQDFIGFVRWQKTSSPSFAIENQAQFGINKHFDGTGIYDITGLESNCRYKIQLCYAPLGTATSDLVWPTETETYCEANTCPENDALAPTTFILGSCRDQGPGEDGLSDKTFGTINKLINEHKIETPDMLWMTGDQIYIDRNTGLKSTGYKKYTELYRKQFTETEFSKLLKMVPAYMQLDDHEVKNDWSYNGMQESKKKRELLYGGMRSFNAYQACLGPVFKDSKDYLNFDDEQPFKQKYWFSIERHDCDFFVMDVRYDRLQSDKTWTLRSTGSDDSQISQLLNWIGNATSEKIHFIVTPVPFFPDPHKFKLTLGFFNFAIQNTRKELWTGNTNQRNEILKAIDGSNAKFIFLSGDVHCSFVTSMTLKSGKKVHSVVSSAFNWMSPGLNKNHFNWTTIENNSIQSGDLELHNQHVETLNNFTHLLVVEPNSVTIQQYNGHNGQPVDSSITI